MKVLLQWTTPNPSDWLAVDSADWAALPVKPEPKGGELIDTTPGWIFQISVQGMIFTGDHYAVIHDDPVGGCTVLCWNDDPEDFPSGDYWGHAVTFLPLAPDAKFGGRYNTRQTHLVYAAETALARMGGKSTLPWADFPVPDAKLVRHGIWVLDTLSVATVGARAAVDWKQWTDGVPAALIDAGGLVRS